MAQASRRLRNARKLKRQNTLLYRALTNIMRERDFYKGILESAAEKRKSKVEITKIEDETEPIIMEGSPAGPNVEQDNQTN